MPRPSLRGLVRVQSAAVGRALRNSGRAVARSIVYRSEFGPDPPEAAGGHRHFVRLLQR